MRSRWFVLCILISSAVFAQTVKPVQGSGASVPPAKAVSAQAPAHAQTASVPDTAAVITLNGVCDPTKPAPVATGAQTAKKAAPTACKTEITKAEFDRILTLFAPAGSPALPPQVKRERANMLAQLLVVAAAAKKQNLQNTPEGKEMLKLSTVQSTANLFVRNLQQTSKPTDAEIEAYYKANPEKFEQAKVQQIFVPPVKSTDGKPADPAERKARAEKLRERAVAGEAFDKLQKEAIENTSYQAAPPVDLTLHKENVPPARQFIFNLKDGEFSAVTDEPSGSLFFKMVSKTQVPLAQVKESISQRLAAEKYEAALNAVVKSVTPTLNEAYFGPATSPQPPQAHGAPVVPPSASTPKQPK